MSWGGSVEVLVGLPGLSEAEMVPVWVDERGESSSRLQSWGTKKSHATCAQGLIVSVEIVGVDHQASQRACRHLVKPRNQRQGCLAAIGKHSAKIGDHSDQYPAPRREVW